MSNYPLPPEASAAAVPVRLLSSVAVVGRDNEPIYLRGDLCECDGRAPAPPRREAAEEGAPPPPSVVSADEDDGAEGDGGGEVERAEEEEEGVSPRSGQGSRGGKGLFGRIKGVVGMNGGGDDDAEAEGDSPGHDDPDEAEEGEEEDGYDDDPFGFFGNDNDVGDSSGAGGMSLTQQLVLHASLDRFEEMACRSNKGGAVRWRTPGSNSANAMWMGLLCQVEERWDVYGYLTNTGIKFMLLVENVYVNRDGVRTRYDHAPPMFAHDPFQRSMSNSSGVNREADLKEMFAQLHELYVRHTLNPFSKLRSPIQSRVFDRGIVQMAQSFNSAALEQISSSLEGVYVGGGSGNRGLMWM